jgi:hypothetical protein
MKASASGQVPIPACVRRGSAAAALAPRLQSSGCADEAALHQPEDPGRQARCWTLADERYERLGAEAKASQHATPLRRQRLRMREQRLQGGARGRR